MGPGRYEFMAGSRNYSGGFQAQTDAIIEKTKKRMLALQRESIQRTIDIAQLPVAKGGKMRVDTGFLRASGQGSLNGMPSGPTRGEMKEPGSYPSAEEYRNDNSVVLALANMQFGSSFYFGWTANYARYREAFDGFLEAAVQQWPQTVAAVTAEIKARIK